MYYLLLDMVERHLEGQHQMPGLQVAVAVQLIKVDKMLLVVVVLYMLEDLQHALMQKV